MSWRRNVSFFYYFSDVIRIESDNVNVLCPVVRQRQEEKRLIEESSKVKERKRKRDKYAEKVQATMKET